MFLDLGSKNSRPLHPDIVQPSRPLDFCGCLDHLDLSTSRLLDLPGSQDLIPRTLDLSRPLGL